VDQMKLDRKFVLNFVAAMATLLCFMTSQVEVTATASDNSPTVCIENQWILFPASPLPDFIYALNLLNFFSFYNEI
jgi:hypothetical protein